MSPKSVAIIGAGASGLVAAKVLMTDGFQVTIFERQSHLGGIWCEDWAYIDLHTQQVSGFMEYSDFIDPDTKDYVPWQHIYNYLKNYSDRFNVTERIRFGTTVLSIDKEELSNTEKPWIIRVKTLDGIEETFEFGLVVVASGLFSTPFKPILRGQHNFNGSIVHASDIKSYGQLENKRVIVLGAGKSAIDLATTSAKHAKSTHLVFRRAQWMLPDYIVGGLIPNRYSYTRAANAVLDPYPCAPHGALFWFIRYCFPKVFDKIFDMMTKDVIASCDPKLFEDKVFLPIGSFLHGENYFRLTDEFIQMKITGRIVCKLSFVDEIIDETTIRLDSGECLQADMIICATGFIERFPFLSEKLSHSLGLEKNSSTSTNSADLDLYRRLVPVDVPNIAFLGLTTSAHQWSLTEVASHWISDYFLGRIKLPKTKTEMYDEIQTTRSFIRKQFNRLPYYCHYYWLEPIEIYLQDMGLSLHRTNNWISEYFGLYLPKRLKTLHEERQNKDKKHNCHWYLGFGHTIIILIILVFLIKFYFITTK